MVADCIIVSRAAYECILLVACPFLFVGYSPREATLAVMRGWRWANPPPKFRERRALLDEEMGCQSSTPRVCGFQTYRSFMTSALNSHTKPSGVTMLWQKSSVRVSPRLRGSSFYSEWEIIERDNVKKREKRKRSDSVPVELCSHWYCKERKGGNDRTISLLNYVAIGTVKREKKENKILVQ